MVASATGPVRRVLRDLGVPKSSYYRWRRRGQSAAERPAAPARVPWNRLTPDEEQAVPDAVDATGMTGVPVEGRTKLLSDNGPGYVSRAFQDYLRLVGIRHILAAPFRPQTNGRLERYHQTIKLEVNQVPYDLPAGLEAAIAGFARFYNCERYHKALGDVTPDDVLSGRREEILTRRKEVQARTIADRKTFNKSRRSQPSPALY